MKLDEIYRILRILRKIFKDCKGLVVAGGQFGDEGKGKIVDLLAAIFDIVVRFSGGAGAGHTVKGEGKKMVFHLIPSGLLQGKICVVGAGVYFDSARFLEEFQAAQQVLGRPIRDIWIDYRCPVWTPYHPLLEKYLESKKGNKIGTTGRGIGPLEGLFKLRMGLQVQDLVSRNQDALRQKLYELRETLDPFIEEMLEKGKILPSENPALERVVDDLLSSGEKIKRLGFVTDTSWLLGLAASSGKKILFEGAQGTGLDPHWGTWPFVTAGNCTAAGAPIGTGLPMQAFDTTILVFKALPSRVGEGPFPSEYGNRRDAEQFPKDRPELFGKDQTHAGPRRLFLAERLQKINEKMASNIEISQYFQVLGQELGASTRRGRSVGRLDLAWLRYAVRINHPEYLALTRLDMLSGLKEIEVVTRYWDDDHPRSSGVIPQTSDLFHINTNREIWPAWDQNISGCNSWEELPRPAQQFVEKVEDFLGVPILIIGTGPERQDIIIRPPKFTVRGFLYEIANHLAKSLRP